MVNERGILVILGFCGRIYLVAAMTRCWSYLLVAFKDLDVLKL